MKKLSLILMAAVGILVSGLFAGCSYHDGDIDGVYDGAFAPELGDVGGSSNWPGGNGGNGATPTRGLNATTYGCGGDGGYGGGGGGCGGILVRSDGTTYSNATGTLGTGGNGSLGGNGANGCMLVYS